MSRPELERAAAAFFARWKLELDQPRHFDQEHFDEDVAQNLEHSRDRIRKLDAQLASNAFDQQVQARARIIVDETGSTFESLSDAEQLFALKLAGRAEREYMRMFIHELTKPHTRFLVEDETFRPESGFSSPPPTRTAVENSISLRDAISTFLRKKAERRLSQSEVDETGRVLNWLCERIGGHRNVRSVTKAELRSFRDDLCRLNVTLRGRGTAFSARLTNDLHRQIKSVTAEKYWRYARSFFAWCAAEGYAEQDNATGLKVAARKGEKKNSPAPFNKIELKQLFSTPLFAGYSSAKRVKTEGACHRREGHWWSCVLLMFTGLRGGELSQLLPDDFAFDADPPHLKVREENDAGQTLKTTKTASSVRDVPISPILLNLGLREFVELRSKIDKGGRVFREFRLGTKGKKSDGLSKFWASYLRDFNLWAIGRSTHVWRHTLIANLRASGAAEEDIAAIVGHARSSITAGYGGVYPLSRKAATIEKIDYGFDVVEALGGPFDPKIHT